MSMVSLRSIFALFSVITVLVGPARAEIVVGFITSQSGPISSIGVPNGRGVMAGHAYINEVGGETIRIITLDDASDASNTSKLARKLIEEDKVDVLIGTSGAPGTAALISVATELNVPVVAISPVGSVPQSNGKPWAVSVLQPATDSVGIVIDHMAKSGIKRFAYIGFSDAWGDLVYNSAKISADKHGMTITANERYARADTSVSGQVLKLLTTRPEAVLVGGTGTGGALPYTALAERSYKGPIFGNVGIISPDFIRLAGATAEGTITSTGPVMVMDQLPDSNPNKAVGLAFRAAHLKANNVPTTDAFSAYGFDGWLILADSAKRALATAKPRTPEFREAMRAAIYSTKELVGTHGVYNFKPESFMGTDRRAVVLVRLEKGQWAYMP